MSNNVRQKQFKNAGKSEEMRRRRAEGSLELRKQRKDEQLMKRRNVDVHDISTEEEGQLAGGDGKSQIEDGKIMPLLECYKALENGSDSGRCQKAVESIRRHLSRHKNPPIDEVIKMGIVPYLAKGLFNQSPQVQFEAAWALTNITSGTSQQTLAAINEGIIPPLVRLLASPDNQVAEQCAWALGNITGDCAQLRDVVIDAGILDALIGLAMRPGISVECMRTLAWTMSNICRYKNPNIVAFHVVQKLAPVLAVLIHHPDAGVVCDVCWALAYMSDGDEERINLVLKAGVLDRLIKLASCQDMTLIAPSLRCLGNIVTGDDKQTQAVIDHGVLASVVPSAFTTGKSALTREACWLISNICAGNAAQIQSVIDSGLITHVIHLLEKGDFRTQSEATWVIYNILSGGTTDQASFLLQNGALSAVCHMLKVKETRILLLALDTVTLLMGAAAKIGQLEAATVLVEECEGLDQIEQLQNHENEDVYQKALQLVEKFFSETEEVGIVDENDDGLAFKTPAEAPAGGFNF